MREAPNGPQLVRQRGGCIRDELSDEIICESDLTVGPSALRCCTSSSTVAGEGEAALDPEDFSSRPVDRFGEVLSHAP
jgi:hypothetical protein